MKILFVDDEPQYLLLGRHYLEDQGWNVTTADNGDDALEKLASSSFDIIVSDVYMPIMDGLKFHKTVRANPKYVALPFLFVSAFDDPHTLSAVATGKHDAFLKKGRAPSEMKEWILYLTTPEEKRGNPPTAGGFPRADRVAPHSLNREDRAPRRYDSRTR